MRTLKIIEEQFPDFANKIVENTNRTVFGFLDYQNIMKFQPGEVIRIEANEVKNLKAMILNVTKYGMIFKVLYRNVKYVRNKYIFN